MKHGDDETIIKNALEKKLNQKNLGLYARLHECRMKIEPLLQRYQGNFAEYTDHSINHAQTVFDYVADLLSDDEIKNLNADEIYILLCACLLHDSGMCIPKDKINEFKSSSEYKEYSRKYPANNFTDFIRDIHHVLSYEFILKEWQTLSIPSEIFAKAIALVALAHRKEDLNNFIKFDPKFAVRSGRTFVCLPYLGCLLRIGDELDITNVRIPEIIYKYYFPKRRNSQIEFEKHRATYIVQFDEDIVRLKGKCESQLSYITLNQLYDKIEGVLNYCQKVIRQIEFLGGRHYTLSISKIKREIKTDGFIPKDIKFSFNIKNVFDYFISKTLYKDKFIAIREALSNAIDTCRYKKVINNDYEPKIYVILRDGSLTVKDNGMGMDEFIVKAYFSQLASSYYQSIDFKGDYDSLAQFGIGVFSYFLICDYFEIKTKMKDKQPLWFRADKDPKKYFFFYDDLSSITEGTEVKLFLKEGIENSLGYDELLREIRYFLRDIEIPIIVKFKQREEIISKEVYKLDLEKDIKNRFKLKYRERVGEIKSISAEIETKDFKGICSLLFHLNELQELEFLDPSWFKRDKFISARSEISIYISIYNKGIFIEDYKDSILDQLFGKINILSGTKLTLNRKDFINQRQINNFIERFEIKIMETLFQKWDNLPEEEKFEKIDMFLENHFLNYVDRAHFISTGLMDFFRDSVYFVVFDKREIKYFTLDEIFERFEKILYFVAFLPNEISVYIDNLNLNAIEDIYNSLNIPILIIFNGAQYSIYDSLVRTKNFLQEIISTNERSIQIFNLKEIETHEFKIGYRKAINFKDNYFCTFIRDDLFFNKKHEIIDFILKNKKKFLKMEDLDELIEEIFEELGHYDFPKKISLKKMNEIFLKINELLSTNFSLKTEDFPNWMRKYLVK